MPRIVRRTLLAVAHPPAPLSWVRIEIALLVGALLMAG